MNRHRTYLACLSMALLSTPLLASWEDGVAAFRAGRYDDAAAVFQSFVSASPQAPEGHYMLGLSLLQQGRADDAIRPLGEAVALAADDASYRMTLTKALLKAGRPKDAFAALEAQDPAAIDRASRVKFYQLLAKVAAESGRDQAAFASVGKALEADRDSKELWQVRAFLADRLGRPQDVFAARAAAFEIDPSDPQQGAGAVRAAIELGRDQDDEGRKLEWYGKAAAVADRLAKAAPTPENLRLAGSANMGAREYETAIGYFERLLASEGDDPLVHFDIGRCRQARGQNREALDHFAAALERSPDAGLAAAVHAERGSALRALEDFAGAAAAYRLAGDAKTADEMAGYAENRREWEKAKAECVVKRDGLRQILADSEGLEQTPEYKAAERDLAAVLEVCAPYFNEQA